MKKELFDDKIREDEPPIESDLAEDEGALHNSSSKLFKKNSNKELIELNINFWVKSHILPGFFTNIVPEYAGGWLETAAASYGLSLLCGLFLSSLFKGTVGPIIFYVIFYSPIALPPAFCILLPIIRLLLFVFNYVYNYFIVPLINMTVTVFYYAVLVPACNLYKKWKEKKN